MVSWLEENAILEVWEEERKGMGFDVTLSRVRVDLLGCALVCFAAECVGHLAVQAENTSTVNNQRQPTANDYTRSC
jgi:hypothetical protein